MNSVPPSPQPVVYLRIQRTGSGVNPRKKEEEREVGGEREKRKRKRKREHGERKKGHFEAVNALPPSPQLQ